jgi:erythromycin esterase-like protein
MRRVRLLAGLLFAIVACGGDGDDGGMPDPAMVAAVRGLARPLAGLPGELDPLVAQLGAADVVVIGDGTHGSEEFYRLRADLTKQLVTERGFRAVVVEADWAKVARANDAVQGRTADPDPLGELRGFPAWMWRNTAVRDFVEWLRALDSTATADSTVGLYGMDLQDLHTPWQRILAYLDVHAPASASLARERRQCFRPGEEEAPAQYAARVAGRPDATCASSVAAELQDIAALETSERTRGGEAVRAWFDAYESARALVDAERYFRTADPTDPAPAWNLRDQHMADTAEAVMSYLAGVSPTAPPPAGSARIVIWCHNSHAGDSASTQAGDDGEVTLGTFVRERHAGSAFLLGLTTYGGTVMAASTWGQSGQRMQLRPARGDSWEGAFHAARLPSFLLMFGDPQPPPPVLDVDRLERAVGVVYMVSSELQSHYFRARIRQQFDAVIHLDQTSAVQPLD